MEKQTINESKLVQLISYLGDKEFKELGLWVRSPIHNTNQNVIDLYDVLKKYRKATKPISTLTVMKQLDMLPRTAREKDVCMRSKQELRRTMHLLTEQIEHFLVWKKTQTETITCKRWFMEELYAREAYQLIPAVMKKARKIHETSTLRDIQYCKDEYQLAEMDLYMTTILKNRNMADNIEQTVDALRQYSVSQLLRYYCSISNARKVVKLEGNYPMMEAVKSYLPESKDIDHYTIRVYYTLLKILEDERTEDYDELKPMIYQKDAFNGSEFRQLLGFLTNFCNRKIHQGNKRFIKEKFDLYKTGLERGVWTEDIRFSEHQFIQMISTALELNQLEWTDNFMEAYGEKLAPDLRENVLNYGKALRAFQAGMYDKAQDFLNTIDTSIDFLFRFRIKILLIKIYYDKNDLTYKNIDTHPINAELETVRYLTRPGSNTKMSENSRLRYANFMNFFKRILNRKKKLIEKETLNISNIEALKTELAEIRPLAERAWLSAKLEELMQQAKP